jgi:hypothetical protein
LLSLSQSRGSTGHDCRSNRFLNKISSRGHGRKGFVWREVNEKMFTIKAGTNDWEVVLKALPTLSFVVLCVLLVPSLSRDN